MSMFDPESIQIGKYIIILDDDPNSEKIWIENEGEGGQFSIEALEKLIDKFYKDNF